MNDVDRLHLKINRKKKIAGSAFSLLAPRERHTHMLFTIISVQYPGPPRSDFTGDSSPPACWVRVVPRNELANRLEEKGDIINRSRVGLGLTQASGFQRILKTRKEMTRTQG